MRIILVHSPGAGDALHNREWLVALVQQHGHDVEYFVAADDWQSALDPRVDLIVAVGGDGTVEKIARHVAGGSIPIGVLPLGTANNVARALGITSTAIPELVANWARGERRPFDTGRAAGPDETFRFIESVGLGLIAESIAEINEGGAGYVDLLNGADERLDAAVGVLREMLRALDPVHADLVLDGQAMSGDYLLLEVMNFGWVGPNLSLVPEADPADGLFDLVLAEDRHRAQLIDDLSRYRFGQRPCVSLPVYTARHVTLTYGKCRLHLDDQLRTGPGQIELTVERHTLTFLV